ncbi:hypothetical protein PGT21_018978 [Puccinia graminis f. sp. tritici]|uniref:Uncharacterized protein n=1 Tax=Puccinia graminis f. sp. tritici TaxID=56615 RepID=A0A5B0LLI6_PUCGR|nr:hypothetical protein PGT21_018978 [Puccinia graminis f. sp. tritici]
MSADERPRSSLYERGLQGSHKLFNGTTILAFRPAETGNAFQLAPASSAGHTETGTRTSSWVYILDKSHGSSLGGNPVTETVSPFRPRLLGTTAWVITLTLSSRPRLSHFRIPPLAIPLSLRLLLN